MKYTLIVLALLLITFSVLVLIPSMSNNSYDVSVLRADVHELSDKDGTLQTIHHGLGRIPTHMFFTAMTEGTTGQTYFSYNLNALGEKKGIGIIRLDDGMVMNGAYIFKFDPSPRVFQGIDTIWAGQDLHNRVVAVFYSLDENELVLKWDKVGNPSGIVRFTIELR